MDEITFTGDLNYVTYLINKYKKDGYVFTKGTERKGTNPIIYRVVMKKVNTNGLTIFVNGEPISCTTGTAYEVTFERTWAPNELEIIQKINKEFTKDNLQEQLLEAVEKEDYETAAKLRDKINAL
jgi:excinuclease UvrABC helicase subunit UvrB